GAREESSERPCVDDRGIRRGDGEIVVVEPPVLGAERGPGRGPHRGREEKARQNRDREPDTRQRGGHLFTLLRTNGLGAERRCFRAQYAAGGGSLGNQNGPVGRRGGDENRRRGGRSPCPSPAHGHRRWSARRSPSPAP